MRKITLTNAEWFAFLDQLIPSPLLSGNNLRRIIAHAKLFSNILIEHNLGQLAPESCLTDNELQIVFRNEQFHFDIDIHSDGTCDWIFVDKAKDTSFGADSGCLDAAYIEYLMKTVNFSVLTEKDEATEMAK